jgi:hypothetical protein
MTHEGEAAVSALLDTLDIPVQGMKQVDGQGQVYVDLVRFARTVTQKVMAYFAREHGGRWKVAHKQPLHSLTPEVLSILDGKEVAENGCTVLAYLMSGDRLGPDVRFRVNSRSLGELEVHRVWVVGGAFSGLPERNPLLLRRNGYNTLLEHRTTAENVYQHRWLRLLCTRLASPAGDRLLVDADPTISQYHAQRGGLLLWDPVTPSPDVAAPGAPYHRASEIHDPTWPPAMDNLMQLLGRQLTLPFRELLQKFLPVPRVVVPTRRELPREECGWLMLRWDSCMRYSDQKDAWAALGSVHPEHDLAITKATDGVTVARHRHTAASRPPRQWYLPRNRILLEIDTPVVVLIQPDSQ